MTAGPGFCKSRQVLCEYFGVQWGTYYIIGVVFHARCNVEIDFRTRSNHEVVVAYIAFRSNDGLVNCVHFEGFGF